MKHILIFFLLFLPIVVFGQYQGEGSIEEQEIKTVKYVLDNANKLDKSDLTVKLHGFVIEQINDENFWFQDASGKIEIEIESSAMPKTPFDEKTKLEIIGDVDSDWLEDPKVSVIRIEFIQQDSIN